MRHYTKELQKAALITMFIIGLTALVVVTVTAFFQGEFVVGAIFGGLTAGYSFCFWLINSLAIDILNSLTENKNL